MLISTTNVESGKKKIPQQKRAPTSLLKLPESKKRFHYHSNRPQGCWFWWPYISKGSGFTMLYMNVPKDSWLKSTCKRALLGHLGLFWAICCTPPQSPTNCWKADNRTVHYISPSTYYAILGSLYPTVIRSGSYYAGSKSPGRFLWIKPVSISHQPVV